MTAFPIPVYQPSRSGNEKRCALQCLSFTWISFNGRFIGQFETGCTDFVGAKYADGVCHGTVALHLVPVTLPIGPGHEVIVPALTSVAGLAFLSLN